MTPRAASDPANGNPPSPLVAAAERLVVRIQALADEVAQLREENAGLRREVRAAVALFDGAAVPGSDSPRRRGAVSAPSRRRRRKGRVRGARGRATPAEVTSDVVRAVLAKLGEATAAQIAAEITTAGAPVSGRAVRFLAERAGAQTHIGEDGQRRYRV